MRGSATTSQQAMPPRVIPTEKSTPLAFKNVKDARHYHLPAMNLSSRHR